MPRLDVTELILSSLSTCEHPRVLQQTLSEFTFMVDTERQKAREPSTTCIETTILA
jgi:hypothetical protein